MTRNSRISRHSVLQLHEMGRSVAFFDAVGESSDYFLLQTQFVYIFVYPEKISRPLLDVKLTGTGGSEGKGIVGRRSAVTRQRGKRDRKSVV